MAQEPKLARCAQHLSEFLELGRLHHVSVGAKFIGKPDVLGRVGRRKDGRGRDRVLGMLAHPRQHIEAIHARHLQIGKKHVWKWVFLAILKSTNAAKIVHHLLPLGRTCTASLKPSSRKAVRSNRASSGLSSPIKIARLRSIALTRIVDFHIKSPSGLLWLWIRQCGAFNV